MSISAIGAAALGFASQKTIGNFIARLFLLGARPFRIGDYVRIGTIEGIVQELSSNYTKVLTLSNNTVSVSQLEILNRDITNYTYERKVPIFTATLLKQASITAYQQRRLQKYLAEFCRGSIICFPGNLTTE